MFAYPNIVFAFCFLFLFFKFKGFFCFVLCFLIDEGYYQGGKFQFETEVPDAYNMVVSSLYGSVVSPLVAGGRRGTQHSPHCVHVSPTQSSSEHETADVWVVNVTYQHYLQF